MPRTDTLARLLAAAGARLALEVDWSPEGIDLFENGRTLEQLLDLADHLPQRSDRSLDFPTFRELAA